MLAPDARRALRAYLRAVAVAEPIQLAVLRHYGVTLAELRAVRLLRDLGRVPISRFADELAISRSTATGLVDRCEERGLIAREAGRDDRRVVYVEVTEKGRSALDDWPLFEESAIGRRIAALSPEQQRQFADVVELLIGEAIPSSVSSVREPATIR